MEEDLVNIEDQKKFLASKTISSRINQRSELSQEIISHKPNFMEKWSLLIFLIIILLMLAATWFVKYPDVIETTAVLIAENAPKGIISRQDGRLVKLFVHNNELVKQNDIIGWIESTASHKEIIELSELFDSSIILFNSGHAEKVSKLFNRPFNNLGEIQAEYQQFITSWQQFNDYMAHGFYSQKKSLLKTDIRLLDSVKKIIYNQKELTEQDLNLAKQTYNMNKQLLNKKVIAKEKYRIEKSKYLNKAMSIPQLQASILSIESQKRDKFKEIDQLEHDMSQQKIIFRQSVESLKSKVDEWMKRYVIKSPTTGKVSFIIPLQENQFIQAGGLLGYVNPDDSHFYAVAYLSQNNFGKIDTGLQVQLRFNAYPYQEMGFVDGTLKYISNVPSDSGFFATIRLDNGLITNNHRQIPYKNGLIAQAIIITKNMRLLERLYYNIIKSTSVGSK